MSYAQAVAVLLWLPGLGGDDPFPTELAEWTLSETIGV